LAGEIETMEIVSLGLEDHGLRSHAVLKSAIANSSVMDGLSRKIVGSQHHGAVGLSLLFKELARCSLFNYFAQPHKLIYALIWPHITPAFKIVHRRGADRTQNYLALIEHRELND
jgi:hypothetical protein